MREEIRVRLLALRCLCRRPLPHVPGDLVGAGFVGRASCVLVGRRWIELQILIRHLAELAIRVALERRGCHAGAAAAGQSCAWSADAEVRLVLVRSGEHVDRVLLPGLERERDILRNHISVDDQPRALQTGQLLHRLRAEFGDCLRAQRLDGLCAGYLRVSRQTHAGHREPHPASAFGDGALEQTFGLRRSDERADHDRAR